MEFKKIFVAGAGTMGNGIVQVCAQSGYAVVMYDLSQEDVDKALEKVRWSVEKLVGKGVVPGSLDEVMGRIELSTDVQAAAGADLVIEIGRAHV